MRMVIEPLTTGMQDGGSSHFATNPLFVFAECTQYIPAGGKEQIAHLSLVVQKQAIELIRYGEDNMEILYFQ